METKKLIDQLKDSQALYEAEIERIEHLSDQEVERNLEVASDSTLDRLAEVASGSTLDRLAEVASDSTLRRFAEVASDSTLDRLAEVASDSTLDRLAEVASGSTLDRLAEVASDSTLDRLAEVASDRTLDLKVPVISNLDALIAESVGENGEALEMNSWHCGTTHCRGGWAIMLAGDEGEKLEAAIGTEKAARLIYEASTGRMAPDFYASNENALADIKARAEQAEGGQ